MPNSPSPEKRRFSYLENRHVAEWFEAAARERGTDMASLVREATLTYYAAQNDASSPTISGASRAISDASRAAEKAARRAETARRIAKGSLSPKAAQARNAPLPSPARVVDLWAALRRRAAQK